MKYMDTPKSSILIGCSIITHPFWGSPIFGKNHIDERTCMKSMCDVSYELGVFFACAKGNTHELAQST